MSAVGVPIKPETLRWAMDWAGLEAEKLARKVQVKPEKVERWLKGEERPTYPQALKLAQALHLGLARLLLPPPEVRLPLKDFRRGRAREEPPSPELLEAFHDAQRKQEWWRERKGKPLPFVGRGKGASPAEVAQEMGALLEAEALRKGGRDHQGFLKALADRAEALGVLVLRQGHVGTHTRRTYDPGEFSGFALVDPVAPVVFLNAREHPSRQVFTLAHELAHVWRGEGGLEGGLEEEAQDEVEAWADQVAAEFLMPEEAFRAAWNGYLPPLEAAREASRRFFVSPRAALERALRLGLVGREGYKEALEALREAAPPRPKGGGGDFWKTLVVQNSPAFVRELRRAALEGEVDAKDVAFLLNVNLRTAWDFLEGKGVPT
ncbi:XRE family transcriptional regulator [Thermus sp.]|uniref:XRE family transcriptional regulator n=1 Tax=Thermus sp. TaxID=275 RepID=UPI003D0BBC13